jgi:DNA-binding transcriptional ArsR family regulator
MSTGGDMPTIVVGRQRVGHLGLDPAVPILHNQLVSLTTSQLNTEADDPLSTTFAALADPTRRAILARLADGEATVNELAQPFDMSVQAISKHLKVLERASLISRSRSAQYRPCRFEAAPLTPAVEWIARYRQVWEERFDQLEQHLIDLQQQQPQPQQQPKESPQ